MALEKEIETLARKLPELLSEPCNQGQFALVKGNEIAGVFPTFDGALSVGYEKYQLAPFLVMEVTQRELPRYFSRILKKCH